MTLTLLLDLDGTLLDMDMQAFLPAYYGELAKYLGRFVDPKAMLAALKSGVNLMLASEDPTRTLQEVFEADFYPNLGMDAAELRPEIAHFYATVFPTLGHLARPRAGAVELIDWALASGHQVAIATDPLFPRAATQARIRWAGLDPERFELISSFETFHFTKTHAAYFAEMLGRLGWPDRPILMVGNDVERDLAPASELGVMTYHVTGEAAARESAQGPEGGLAQLKSWLNSSSFDAAPPQFNARSAIMAVLRATPAVLHSMVLGLSPAAWKHEPSPQEWAMIELVCHLRDTEREVHSDQITRLLTEHVPFVPRPDAAVWAKQRRYLDEDGPAAVRQFAAARLAALQRLSPVPDSDWAKPARHAIFGPSNFLEVVGFMAQHDRLHVQQAWNTLNALQHAAHPN